MNRYKLHETRPLIVYPMIGQVWVCKNDPKLKLKLESFEPTRLPNDSKRRPLLWSFSGFDTNWPLISESTLISAWELEQV